MIEVLASTPSTNAELASRLARGELLREGDWLVADRQTAGRGRHGREWCDGAGNFMGSTIVHVLPTDPPSSSLALLAGLALYEVVSPLLAAPHKAMLKWPNDLLIGRAKLAGILLERQGDSIVVGIGVNLANAPSLDGRETVCLSAIGVSLGRDAFAEMLARQFDLELERWRSYGIEIIIKRWLVAGHPLGTPLSVSDASLESPFVTFHGLAPDGSLQLRLASGELRTIHAGEVNLAD